MNKLAPFRPNRFNFREVKLGTKYVSKSLKQTRYIYYTPEKRLLYVLA
jgi:hypothetical protein